MVLSRAAQTGVGGDHGPTDAAVIGKDFAVMPLSEEEKEEEEWGRIPYQKLALVIHQFGNEKHFFYFYIISAFV